MKKTLFLLIHVLAFAVGSIKAVNQNHAPIVYHVQNSSAAANNQQQITANPLPNQIIPVAQQNQPTHVSKFSRDITAAQQLQRNSIKIQQNQLLAHKILQDHANRQKTEEQLEELNKKIQISQGYINNRNNYNYFSKFRPNTDITKNPDDEKKFETLPQNYQQYLINKRGIVTKEVKREKARNRVAFAIVGTACFVVYKCFGDLRTIFSE